MYFVYTAQLLQEIQEYQRIAYNFEVVSEIRNFIVKAKGFSSEDNYRLSLQVEPPRRPKKLKKDPPSTFSFFSFFFFVLKRMNE